MSKLDYRYQLEEALVAVEDLLGGKSVYMHCDEVLTQIEAEAGSLAGKHVLCRGEDGVWDLVLPALEARDRGILVYPLGTDTLEGAKAKLRHLVVAGKVQGKIP